MKLKRIIAGMAAAVMAFSTMSIGASAYSQSFNLSFTAGSQYNTTSQSWNVVVTSLTQDIYTYSFSRPSNSQAELEVYNSLDGSLQVTYSNPFSKTSHLTNTFDDYHIYGTTITIRATLKKYGTGLSASASGSFVG